MILPTRHIRPENSTIGVGYTLLSQLEQPRGVGELWDSVRERPGVNTYDRFCEGLTALFALGLIDFERASLTIRRRHVDATDG